MPVLLVNNVPANVVYAGLSAAGLYQVNAVLPDNLPDGDMPVSLQVDGVTSPAGALITIRK
jgi:uncharacterized protein (TIGR03437 family)